MNLTYFKRYRMEMDLAGRDLSDSEPPQGYEFLAWDPSLLDAFAKAKYLSFRDEIDANVFPCLGEFSGCRRLMRQIVRKPGFLPGATWLAVYTPPGNSRPEYCGTIQGIRNRQALGAIQNLGIAPGHRDGGLGSRLLYRSLEGFRKAGMQRVFLEVTANNEGAIRLYQRAGFSLVKTVFKAAEVAYS